MRQVELGHLWSDIQFILLSRQITLLLTHSRGTFLNATLFKSSIIRLFVKRSFNSYSLKTNKLFPSYIISLRSPFNNVLRTTYISLFPKEEKSRMETQFSNNKYKVAPNCLILARRQEVNRQILNNV